VAGLEQVGHGSLGCGWSQQHLLARTFGCARVVFNDALRNRDAAHHAGEKISDADVQRRVVTLAKTTPERVWLGDLASVALVQACQDARPRVPELVRSCPGSGKAGRSVTRGSGPAGSTGSRSASPATDSASPREVSGSRRSGTFVSNGLGICRRFRRR